MTPVTPSTDIIIFTSFGHETKMSLTICLRGHTKYDHVLLYIIASSKICLTIFFKGVFIRDE